jgi:hypothetical protein
MKRGDLVRLVRPVRIGEVEAPAGYVMRVAVASADPGTARLVSDRCLLCVSFTQLRVPLDSFEVVDDG